MIDPIDAETVARLLLTSSPAARWRYLREERDGTPAYDRPPVGRRWDPRDYTAACPVCGRVVVVVGAIGGRPRYCSANCRQRHYYRARKERAA